MTVKTLADQTGLQLHLLYRVCKKLGIKKRNVDFGYTYIFCYDLTHEETLLIIENYEK